MEPGKNVTSLDGASFTLTANGYAAMTLQSWTNAPFSTRSSAAAVVSGVVHLKAAIATSGTVTKAFTLPASLHPSATVYVPVDLCGAQNGRLIAVSQRLATCVRIATCVRTCRRWYRQRRVRSKGR